MLFSVSTKQQNYSIAEGKKNIEQLQKCLNENLSSIYLSIDSVKCW